MAKKALVIEEDWVLQYVYNSVLRREGFEPVAVATADEAVAELIAGRPDIVLLDTSDEASRCSGLLYYVPEATKVIDTGGLRGRGTLTDDEVERALELLNADLVRALKRV